MGILQIIISSDFFFFLLLSFYHLIFFVVVTNFIQEQEHEILGVIVGVKCSNLRDGITGLFVDYVSILSLSSS